MAIFKHESYSDCRVATGDDEFDSEHSNHLRVTGKELIRAINEEGLTDKIWARVLKSRTKAHNDLMENIHGAQLD